MKTGVFQKLYFLIIAISLFGSPGLTSLVGHWTFDEGAGTAISDSSGLENSRNRNRKNRRLWSAALGGRTVGAGVAVRLRQRRWDSGVLRLLVFCAIGARTPEPGALAPGTPRTKPH